MVFVDFGEQLIPAELKVKPVDAIGRRNFTREELNRRNENNEMINMRTTLGVPLAATESKRRDQVDEAEKRQVEKHGMP